MILLASSVVLRRARVHRPAAAAERFDRALEALEPVGAEDESGPILLARGDALLRGGEPDAAREGLERATSRV